MPSKPGSCRSNHGIDSGMHPNKSVGSKRIGTDDGCPTGARFQHCSYCTLVHKDPHIQNLYPLRPEQHLRMGGQTDGVHVFGQAAGKPSELFIPECTK